MTIDIEPLKKQLGRKIEDEDVVTQAPIKAMIATFDRPDKVPTEGEPIAPVLVDAFETLEKREGEDDPEGVRPKDETDKTHAPAALGYGLDEIKGKSRRRPLVAARQVAMYVMRELTDLSYPAIAREFGGRDHTTVLHAFNKISLLREQDRKVAADLEILEAELFA